MILCVGTTPVMQRSMVFETLHLDEVNRAVDVSDYASGKSINVAKVAQTLGEDCLVTGFLGGDTGRFIRQDLNTLRVPHDFVDVGPRTRMCVTVIDRATGQVTELVEESGEVEPIAWEALRTRVSDYLSGTGCQRVHSSAHGLAACATPLLVLSGSLPPNAPQDFYAFCIERATAANVRTLLDASGEPLRQALSKKPFIVKPNRSELAKTLNTSIASDTELRDAIKRLLGLGHTWAIVTEGESGVTVSDGQQFWRIRAPQVKTISPIGSGDALAAGTAVALVRGDLMPEAACLGVACGAANAMTDRAGVLHQSDVDELLMKIEVESWG